MNVQSRVFPSVTGEWPFQDHFPSQTIINQLCLLRDLNNESVYIYRGQTDRLTDSERGEIQTYIYSLDQDD